MNEIVSELIKHDEIIFGPFVGELSWELFRWSGFIKWFSKKYPDIRILISTMNDRIDLYNDIFKEIDTFEIEGDRKSGYTSNISSFTYNKILEPLKDRYKSLYLFEPIQFGTNRNVFDLECMDHTYSPRKANSDLLESVILNNKDKIPIVLTSSQYNESSPAIWGDHNWKLLMELLNNSNEYIVFNSGFSELYYKPPIKFKNIVDLDFYDNYAFNTSKIGFLIEAIKKSTITVGLQTNVMMLSNLLKVPTIFWGYNVKHIDRFNNPHNIANKCITTSDYKIHPTTIYNEIKKFRTWRE